MSPVIIFVLFVALSSSQAANPSTGKPKAPAVSADAAAGKEIFVARCAKCHDADANKKLPDGSTLLERLAKSKDPEARLGTRLKDERERHQVFLYIQSLNAR